MSLTAANPEAIIRSDGDVMKKLLLATAVIALTCAHAHANPMTIPVGMLGWWCPVPQLGLLTLGRPPQTYVRSTKKQVAKSDDCIEIRHTGPRNSYGMYGRNGGCIFTNTERKPRVNMDEPYSDSAYIVDMECPGKSTITLQLIDGNLTLWPDGD